MTHCKTKAIKNAYENWERSRNYDLYDCYANPSANKIAAMRYCCNIFIDHDGADMKIIGYNTMTFSVGFMGIVDGRNAFIYITKDYDRYIFMDELEA